ncbi:MAG: 1,4-dihydroxy-6-naphthoate synthase [Prevotellaceae bacterium]|jgi:1,4-dihydroxy-6-naphthoate synthase|nr:1,4-dihydroxy-6-naphthoate synthase [Prevotellaceae bacterium]
MTLGFSPCPNDTFIFHALLHGKVDTEGLTFAPHIADVEELNALALRGELEVTKLSYAAYTQAADKYLILDAGSALGRGNGPLLVTKNVEKVTSETRVAIPGKYTTAAFLLRLAFPQLQHFEETLFSDIPQAIMQGKIDAGALIHESRFTYAQQGLRLLADLGAKWEERSGLPIPLGCICVRRNVTREQQQAMARAMRRSVEYAMQNPSESRAFVKQHAQELSDEVTNKHIAMFVNEYTRSLGEEGRNAVKGFFAEAQKQGVVGKMPQQVFL